MMAGSKFCAVSLMPYGCACLCARSPKNPVGRLLVWYLGFVSLGWGRGGRVGGVLWCR